MNLNEQIAGGDIIIDDLEGAETPAAAVPAKSPRLPHERDEAVGMTNRQPDARIKKGHDDVERGAQDTSRAPEADQTYRQLKQAPPRTRSNKR